MTEKGDHETKFQILNQIGIFVKNLKNRFVNFQKIQKKFPKIAMLLLGALSINGLRN